MPAVLGIVSAANAREHSPLMALRSLGGAVSRVPDDDTAYAYRRAELLVVTTAVGPKPVVEAGRSARRALWERLAPHVRGAYANFESLAADDDVAAVYPEPTYHRLAAVKRRYDPDNVFTGNLNVRPAKEPGKQGDHASAGQVIADPTPAHRGRGADAGMARKFADSAALPTSRD